MGAIIPVGNAPDEPTLGGIRMLMGPSRAAPRAAWVPVDRSLGLP